MPITRGLRRSTAYIPGSFVDVIFGQFLTVEYLDAVEVDWDTENYVLDVMEGRDTEF